MRTPAAPFVTMQRWSLVDIKVDGEARRRGSRNTKRGVGGVVGTRNYTQYQPVRIRPHTIERQIHRLKCVQPNSGMVQTRAEPLLPVRTQNEYPDIMRNGPDTVRIMGRVQMYPKGVHVKLTKPRATVDAAWADYCQRADAGQSMWKWRVLDVMARNNYVEKNRLYRDLDACGYTVRREPQRTRRERGAQEPPCPGVNVYCVFCDLMPPCADWDCRFCQHRHLCPCQLPKSQKWTAGYNAFLASQRRKGRSFDNHMDSYGGALSRERHIEQCERWEHDNDGCAVCGCAISHKSTMCREHSNTASGMRRELGITRDEAVEILRKKEER